MRITTSLLLLILVCFSAKAQKFDPDLKSWLNKSVISLDDDYLKQLDKDVAGKTVVGLGEMSHGTEEVFREKNKIVQHLIRSKKYTQVGLEFYRSFIEPINAYLSGGNGDLKSIMKDLRMFKSQTFYELFQWIRTHNDANPRYKVTVFGFDEPENKNPFTRDSLMAESLIKRQTKTKEKVVVWAHNVHLSRDTALGYKPLGHYLDKKYKRQFLNIAFDTYEGSVMDMIVNEDGSASFKKQSLTPPTDNFTALFAKQKYASFYLPFTAKNPFSDVRSSITFIRVNSSKAFTMPITFGKDYDALIFMKLSTAAVLLN